MFITFAVQPHKDGQSGNYSNRVVFVKPALAHMMFPRKHGHFGRQGVRIFHHARHFLKGVFSLRLSKLLNVNYKNYKKKWRVAYRKTENTNMAAKVSEAPRN